MQNVVHRSHRVSVMTIEGLFSHQDFEGHTAHGKAMSAYGKAADNSANLIVAMFNRSIVFGPEGVKDSGWEVEQIDDLYGRAVPGRFA